MSRTQVDTFVRVASLAAVRERNCLSVQADRHTLVLFAYDERVYAVDNRCPHMGFPLDRGTVRDGILVCHWHHARFDLESGGTFDLFADDVRTFPVELRGDDVFVDLSPQTDPGAYYRRRLQDGLERNISLVVAKSIIALLEQGVAPVDPFGIGVEFGVRYRGPGWGSGLTMHTCMINLLPTLAPEDRARALYHGLSAVANDTDGMAPRFTIQPLPESATTDFASLKRWFRQFVEVRDRDGAERTLLTAIQSGASPAEIADLRIG